MIPIYFRLAAFLLLGFLTSVSQNVTSQPGLDSRSCIAGLCIFPENLPVKKVIDEYGGDDNAQELCYSIREGGLCLIATPFEHPQDITEFVKSLEIKKDGCDCRSVIEPRKSFQTVLTSEGLGVGDSYNKVISLYGLPKWIRAKKASSARELGLNAEVIQIDPDFGDELLHVVPSFLSFPR